MSRRAVFLTALTLLAVLGAAAAPWTLTGNGLSTAVTEHMKDRYGLDFRVEGRSTFALLPIPRVKFENVAVAFPGGTITAEGGTLRGELRLLPLVLGRIELSEIALSGTRVSASYSALRQVNWADLLESRMNAAHARRLIVAESSFQWTDLENAALDRVNAVVSWPGSGEPLQAVGTAVWRNEMVSLEKALFYPGLLATDRLSPFSLALAAPSGRIALTGEAQIGDDPRMTGESTIKASSVRDFTRWSGVELPFGSLMGAMSVTGDFSMNRRRLSWPSVAVTLGTDKLEGTMGISFDAERPLITGTLAADRLDLSAFFIPLLQSRTASGAWSEETIDLRRTTGSDLDLRLSASSAELGRLSLDDVAASVLVRPGRIEASIGRADLHEGTFKGRLSLATQNGVAEFKSQGTFTGVDIAAFLSTTGQPRWITGRAQGQLQIEGTGRSPAEVIRHAHGRSSVTVKNGELVGLALEEVLRRIDKRPLLASLNWKGGRTSFAQAQVQLVLKDGVGEITESHVKAPTLQTEVRGQVSLIERNLRLKAGVSHADSASGETPAIVFDIKGGWDNVVVTPNARSLIERSGAAKPLFGPEQPLSDSQAPLATAQ